MKFSNGYNKDEQKVIFEQNCDFSIVIELIDTDCDQFNQQFQLDNCWRLLDHRFILFENLKFFGEKIVHFKNLGKSLLIQRYSILYIFEITKGS